MVQLTNNNYGSFQDIIDTVAAENNTSVFGNYKPKKDIGKEIFKELYIRFNHDSKKGPIGFYMDDSKNIGLLSQCQSLQALLLLPSNFSLDFDDDHIISESEENKTIREIMDIIIEDILSRIETEEEHIYRFDASPYESNLFTVKHSYIEAITWVVPCFLQTLKYHATIGETCQWEKKLVDVISYSLRYLNDSFIKSKSVLGEADKLEIGWNFTNDCEEPSLYFSFAVCECIVEFRNTFKDYLDLKNAEKNQKVYGFDIPDALETMRKEAEKKYKELQGQTEKKHVEKNGVLREQAQFDPYNELRLRYIEINNGIETIEDSLYGDLQEKCMSVANEIWRISKEHMADDFYYNDLSTRVSEEDISISTTSDALFNTVYMINIMIDAGLHDELQLERKKYEATEPDKAFEKKKEYDNLLESCQLASQRALRTFEKLKDTGKEYIVEQFLVGFNEKFDNHKDLVRELRKRRMRVFSLLPLLIRTNNVISEYLVRYPQVNMKKYLGYILDNRFVDKNKTKWIWEKDGFFSASNYYFISALGQFYIYYETYEGKYISNFTENEAQRQAIIEEYDQKQRNADGDIGRLTKENQDKDTEIARLKEELSNVKRPVEDAISVLISAEMERLLPAALCKFMEDAAAGLTVNGIDDTPCDDTHTALSNAMKELLFAMLSEYIYDEIRSNKVSKSENAKNYRKLKTEVKKEAKRSIQSFIANTKNKVNNN